MESNTEMAVMIICILALNAVVPLITICALNTLGMSLSYTFTTWLATWWLTVVLPCMIVKSNTQ